MLHFFQKVHKWLDMGKHGTALSAKVEQLERNFSVSSIVFEKYLSIFDDIYIKNWTESIKRGRRYYDFNLFLSFLLFILV